MVETAPRVRACHVRSKRCADARNYERELRSCCRAHIRGLLRDVAETLDEAGITWWADYGTLLGAVRNPLTTWSDYPWLPQEGRDTEGPAAGIIPHDKDADLGALFEDWNEARLVLSRMAQSRGYHFRANANTGSIKVRLSNINHTNVDLFFWLRRHNGTYYRRRYVKSLDTFKGRDFPKAMLFPLTTVEWEGMTIPAPADPPAFLTMRYNDWMTPIPANNDGVPRE